MVYSRAEWEGEGGAEERREGEGAEEKRKGCGVGERTIVLIWFSSNYLLNSAQHQPIPIANPIVVATLVVVLR